MLNHKLSKKLVITAGLVVAMGAFGASQSEASQKRTRTSVSKGSQSRGNSGRTAAVRSGGNRSRGAGATRSGGSVRNDRGRGSRHYRSGRHHRYGLGLGHIGYYGRYGAYFGGYGGYYYNPFYYGYPVYYSHHPRRYADFGALDINVRPKKTEVWVDGQYIGTAGRFDGYPGYLWLGDGRHEVIFFKQGFETVVREVKVLEGVVLDIHQEMLPGASVPAEELTVFSQEDLRQREEDQAYRGPREMGEPADRREKYDDRRRSDRSPIKEDIREEPGRLKLEIVPADATIYLDGRFLGSGQELSRLHSGLIVSPGDHTLEVVRPGFDSEEVPFSVEPGKETALQIDLEQARV